MRTTLIEQLKTIYNDDDFIYGVIDKLKTNHNIKRMIDFIERHADNDELTSSFVIMAAYLIEKNTNDAEIDKLLFD